MSADSFDLYNIRCINMKCRSKEVIVDTECGEIICTKCGVVIMSGITDKSHMFKNMKNDKENPQTNKSSHVLYDKGLSSNMDYNKDVSGKKLTVSTRNRFKKLRKLDKRTKSDNAEIMPDVLFFISYLCEVLNLTNNIQLHTIKLYKKLTDGNVTRGRSRKSLAAACIYVSCREFNVPRTLREITKVSDIRRKEITRGIRLLNVEFGVKIARLDNGIILNKLANKLNVPESVKREAFKIMNSLDKTIYDGKNPIYLNAAILYVSIHRLKYEVSYKKIADVAETNDVTIRSNCKILFELGFTF